MKAYIDKTALIAEIEKELNTTKKYSTEYVNGKKYALNKILSFLDTLEVKENDLVEELDYDDYIAFFKEHPEYNNGDWGFDECWVFAKYFFELGLKVAQKGG